MCSVALRMAAQLVPVVGARLRCSLVSRASSTSATDTRGALPVLLPCPVDPSRKVTRVLFKRVFSIAIISYRSSSSSACALGVSSPSATWDLSHYWPGERSTVLSPSDREAVIVLNYHLPKNTELYWKTPGIKIAADGGLKRLHDHFPT